MKKLKQPLNSNKDKLKVSSKLKSEMTTTGSQMRISSFSSTTQTLFKSLKVKILELESLSSMMTSLDKFASRRLKPSRLSPQKKMLKLSLLERMDLTELSKLTTRLFNLMLLVILLLQESITSLSRVPLLSFTVRPVRPLMSKFLKEKMRKLEMSHSVSNC